MLKQDMRNAKLDGKTYEEFVEEFGEKYKNEFSMQVMEACWRNTDRLLDETEWIKYLKNRGANYVRYLGMIAGALDEMGIGLAEIRAGYWLKDLYAEYFKETPETEDGA